MPAGDAVRAREWATLGYAPLAKKVPPLIRDRTLERPDAFCKVAALDDASLGEVNRRHKARF